MSEEKEQNYVESVDMLLHPLYEDEFYNFFIKNVESNDYQYEYNKKTSNKIVEKEWLEMIESCLIPLDNIVRKPRKFIKQEEDIVSIALAKKITTDSIKHLAQHTNMISSIDASGLVTPERILNINKEESLEVYENRFVYTLLLKLHAFVAKRMNLILSSLQENESASVSVINNFKIDNYKYNYKMEISYSKIERLDSETRDTSQMTDVQRVARVANIIKDFLSSPFANDMKKSPLVRPPITRTNAILKDQNLKKALVLWQFIESYNKDGFFVENDSEANTIASPYADKLQDTLFLNYLHLRNFLDPKNPRQKTQETSSKRKMAKNLLSTLLDEKNLSEVDFQEIYDRMWAKKVKPQKLNKQKYGDIIDKALKTDREIKLIKEKIRKEEEQKRIAEAKAIEEKKKEEEQKKIAAAIAKEEKKKEEEQKKIAAAIAREEKKKEEEQKKIAAAIAREEKKKEEEQKRIVASEAVISQAKVEENNLSEKIVDSQFEHNDMQVVEEEQKRIAASEAVISQAKAEENNLSEKIIDSEFEHNDMQVVEEEQKRIAASEAIISQAKAEENNLSEKIIDSEFEHNDMQVISDENL